MAYTNIIARKGYFGDGLGGFDLFSATPKAPETLQAPAPKYDITVLGQPPKTAASTQTTQEGPSFLSKLFAAFTPQAPAQQPGYPAAAIPQAGGIPWVPILVIGGVGVAAVVLLSRKKKAT